MGGRASAARKARAVPAVDSLPYAECWAIAFFRQFLFALGWEAGCKRQATFKKQALRYVGKTEG